jgi:hypothetical protein
LQHSYTPRPADGYGAKSKKSSDRKKISVDRPLSSTLPQKRTIEDVEAPKPSESVDGVENNKFVLFPKSTIDYLNAWMSQNAATPFPTTSQKTQIAAATGLNKRQVGDWLARARRKLRVKSNKPSDSSAGVSARPASIPSADIASVKSLPSDAANAENLLLGLENQPMLLQDVAQENTHLAAVQQGSQADASTGKLGISSLIAELESDKHKISTKEFEIYMMKDWRLRLENTDKLYPSSAEKEKIITETGIDKKRLEGWFSRARKKLKSQNIEPVIHSVVSQPPVSVVSQESVLSAPTAAIVNAEGPNFDASHTVQPAVTISKDNPNHSLTPIEVTSMRGSIADNNVLNSPFNTGKASMCVLASTALEEQANPPPSATLASTKSQTQIDSHHVFDENNLATTMKVAKVSDTIKSSSSSTPKGLTEEAKAYLSRWMSEHSWNPYPTREEKVAMMRHLEIPDEKKLDGWFCRARKRHMKNGSSNKPAKDDKVKVIVKHQGNHVLLFPGHDRAGQNDIIQTDRNVGSARIPPAQGLSNFASLLSAASLINTDTGNASTHVRVDEPTAHDSEHSQQQTKISLHVTQDGLAAFDSEKNHAKVGAREKAILATFQTLQSMKIVDRPPRASPTDRLLYQQPQQRLPSDHSSYHNSQLQQRASPAEYIHHPEYSSDFSSYQYSRDQLSVDPADHFSYQTSQVQARASPAGNSYQYPQRRERASFTEHPHYQHSEEPQQGQGFHHPAPICVEISSGRHPQSDDFYYENNMPNYDH